MIRTVPAVSGASGPARNEVDQVSRGGTGVEDSAAFLGTLWTGRISSPDPAGRGMERRRREADMTTTSRGAVAPTGDQLRTGTGATAGAVAPVDTAALDAIVHEVADHAASWAKTDAATRADLLQQVIAATMKAEEEWLAAACAAKGLEPGSTEAGEELFAGIGTFVRMARLFRDALRDIAKDGKPSFAGPVREAYDGRLRVQVFPESPFDRITFPQTTAEVWMQPGVSREALVAGQAPAYADPSAHTGTALVLAAGNVASLGPRDVLSKLFVGGKVVVMKANPVNDYLVPHWSRALAPLIDAHVLRIVDGGAAVGEYLTHHPRIDEVHITGSDKTYDAVVFGTGPDGAQRKAADEPVLDKPVTVELGNVSPVIVVPGTWSIAELRYQAEHVATMLVNNAGFNCISARVVVTHAAWPQRDAFLGALTQTLAGITTRRAYYPGARDRREAFVDAHPEAQEFRKRTRRRAAVDLHLGCATRAHRRYLLQRGVVLRRSSRDRADGTVGRGLRRRRHCILQRRRLGNARGDADRQSLDHEAARRRRCGRARQWPTCATAPSESTSGTACPSPWGPRPGARIRATPAPISSLVPVS